MIIGETAELGDNVTLYQGVTLGGTGKEKGKRHPTLKDNVMVSAARKCLAPSPSGRIPRLAPGRWYLRKYRQTVQ